MEQEKIGVKSNKHSYGKYLLIFAFLAAMFSSLEQNIKPHSLSALSAFFRFKGKLGCLSFQYLANYFVSATPALASMDI